MIKHIGWIAALLGLCLQLAAPGRAQEETDGVWPREISMPKGVVVIYQPQPEKLDGNQLKARAAVSVELKKSTEPVFGAVWFDARLETDRAERTATIADVSVIRVRFPEQDDAKAQQLIALLEKEIPKWQLPISMDRLLATLELADQRAATAQQINTDPPKILFVPEPAVLISLDGEPRLQPEEGSKLMRVINTPYTILLESSQKTYYLYADVDTWYAAGDIQGEWKVTKKVPAEVAARAPKAESESAEPEADDAGEPGPSPKVIVVTEPTELISSNGKPEYTPISGTDLLYMSNTDSDVLLLIKNQEHYVLLAGRWYASAKLDGPWRYVPGEKLPPDFAKIPEEAEMGTVLYAVPGTDIAKEAVLDTQIPQTAAVDRKKAKLTVEYDGDPKFETIKSTKMKYAVNTATPVIRVSSKYYACDQAVWFVADKPKGPWQVARHGRCGLCRLHPGLHQYLCVQHHDCLWYGILVPRLVWTLVLSAPGHLGLSCTLESLDRLALRPELQLRAVSLYHRRWRLVSGRLVGPGPLPGVSAWISSRLPPRPPCRLSSWLPGGSPQCGPEEPVSVPTKPVTDRSVFCFSRQAC
jgi:hypothetical protein